MRRITEFKGYKSTIEYNPQTGDFETVRVPEAGEELTLDETLDELDRIVPFPDPHTGTATEAHRTRKTG